MKKLILLIVALAAATISHAQNTVTLPSGTSPGTAQFRTKGVLTDSLNKRYWILFPGGAYNELYTATYINANFVRTGAGSTAWGSITGTLSDQTDLQAALDAKSPILTFSNGLTDDGFGNISFGGTLTGNTLVDVSTHVLTLGAAPTSANGAYTSILINNSNGGFTAGFSVNTINRVGFSQYENGVMQSAPGTFRIGNNSLGNGHNGGTGIVFNSTTGSGQKKGLMLFDDEFSIGGFYDKDFHVAGISNYGDRWIPDVGYVNTLIAAGGGGTTTNPLTVNNSGTGDASSFTFDGSVAKTLSYNSIGANPLLNGTGYVKQAFTTTSYSTTIPYSDLSGTVPTWNQNTIGTAANVSGTPALPNGTTATTQTTGDNTAKLATDAFVNLSIAAVTTPTLQSVATAGNSYSAQIQAQNFLSTGTANAGFYEMGTQSASPASVTNHIRLYSDSLNRLSWKNSLYRRTIQVPYPSDYTARFPYRVTGTTLEDSTHAATTYQAILVSGSTLKTVNSTTLLGSGNLAITTANTDTLSTGFRTSANSRTLAQEQTALNLKLNISDTAAMAYVHKAINENITGIKTYLKTGLGTTTVSSIVLSNTTPALTGAQQITNAILWTSSGFASTSGTSRDVSFRAYSLPVQGTANPTGLWHLQASVNGAGFADMLTVDNGGSLNVANGISAGGAATFSSSINAIGANIFTGSQSGGSTANSNAAFEFDANTFQARVVFSGSSSVGLTSGNSGVNYLFTPSSNFITAPAGTNNIIANAVFKPQTFTATAGSTVTNGYNVVFRGNAIGTATNVGDIWALGMNRFSGVRVDSLLTLAAGDLTVSTGNVNATAGNISAGGFVNAANFTTNAAGKFTAEGLLYSHGTGVGSGFWGNSTGTGWFTITPSAANTFSLGYTASSLGGTPTTVLNWNTSGNVNLTNGNFTLSTAGNKINITEGANGSIGQTALVAGTKAITITGLTTSSRAIVTLVTPTGVALTTSYQGVCTTNTLTLQANVAAGTINTADTSTLNYLIIN